MMKKLLVIVLLLSGFAAAQCGTAVSITSGPTLTSSVDGQSITFAVNTNVPTDIQPSWGDASASPALESYNAGVFDTAGSTTHSVTIPGFVPNSQYGVGIRLRQIQSGSPCPQSEWLFWGFLGSQRITTSAVPAGTYDYLFRYKGPTHVTVGHTLYIPFSMPPLVGTAVSMTLTAAVTNGGSMSGANMSFYWPDPQWFQSGSAPTTTSVANDTWHNTATDGTTKMIEVVTNCPSSCAYGTGGTTPTGNYTLTVTGSGTGVITHSFSINFSVDPVPNVAQGTPTSYPPIPCLTAASKQMDGTTACSHSFEEAFQYLTGWCSEDMDVWNPALRTVRTINTANPCTVGVSGAGQKCMWYYDAKKVFWDYGDYIKDQSTYAVCRSTNINYIYRDAYVANASPPGNIQEYTAFVKGFYEDVVRNNDAASRTALDNIYLHASYAADSHHALFSNNFQREGAYSLLADERESILPSPVIKSWGTNNFTAAQWRDRKLDALLQQLDMFCRSHTGTNVEFFMLGLQMSAAIDYWNQVSQDPRILDLVKCTADYAFANYWNKEVATPGTFPYDAYRFDQGALHTSSVLENMLIGEAYAWLFKTTGDATYQNEFDQIFQAGVQIDQPNTIGYFGTQSAPGNGGKQTSQFFYTMFAAVNDRSSPGQFIPASIRFSEGARVRGGSGVIIR